MGVGRRGIVSLRGMFVRGWLGSGGWRGWRGGIFGRGGGGRSIGRVWGRVVRGGSMSVRGGRLGVMECLSVCKSVAREAISTSLMTLRGMAPIIFPKEPSVASSWTAPAPSA